MKKENLGSSREEGLEISEREGTGNGRYLAWGIRK
jgi:hypothetical protein